MPNCALIKLISQLAHISGVCITRVEKTVKQYSDIHDDTKNACVGGYIHDESEFFSKLTMVAHGAMTSTTILIHKVTVKEHHFNNAKRAG